jgi:hypothetical protein
VGNRACFNGQGIFSRCFNGGEQLNFKVSRDLTTSAFVKQFENSGARKLIRRFLETNSALR